MKVVIEEINTSKMVYMGAHRTDKTFLKLDFLTKISVILSNIL